MKIRLEWTEGAPNSPGDGYKVYRSVNGGSFSLLATLPLSQTYYEDESVTSGNLYIYRVCEYLGSMESPPAEGGGTFRGDSAFLTETHGFVVTLNVMESAACTEPWGITGSVSASDNISGHENIVLSTQLAQEDSASSSDWLANSLANLGSVDFAQGTEALVVYAPLLDAESPSLTEDVTLFAQLDQADSATSDDWLADSSANLGSLDIAQGTEALVIYASLLYAESLSLVEDRGIWADVASFDTSGDFSEEYFIGIYALADLFPIQEYSSLAADITYVDPLTATEQAISEASLLLLPDAAILSEACSLGAGLAASDAASLSEAYTPPDVCLFSSEALTSLEIFLLEAALDPSSDTASYAESHGTWAGIASTDTGQGLEPTSALWAEVAALETAIAAETRASEASLASLDALTAMEALALGASLSSAEQVPAIESSDNLGLVLSSEPASLTEETSLASALALADAIPNIAETWAGSLMFYFTDGTEGALETVEGLLSYVSGLDSLREEMSPAFPEATCEALDAASTKEKTRLGIYIPADLPWGLWRFVLEEEEEYELAAPRAQGRSGRPAPKKLVAPKAVR